MEAKSSHGRYCLFTFCYREIMKKNSSLSWDNGSFSCDNEINCQVSFHHMIETESVVHGHTDLACQDLCQQHH